MARLAGAGHGSPQSHVVLGGMLGNVAAIHGRHRLSSRDENDTSDYIKQATEAEESIRNDPPSLQPQPQQHNAQAPLMQQQHHAMVPVGPVRGAYQEDRRASVHSGNNSTAFTPSDPHGTSQGVAGNAYNSQGGYINAASQQHQYHQQHQHQHQQHQQQQQQQFYPAGGSRSGTPQNGMLSSVHRQNLDLEAVLNEVADKVDALYSRRFGRTRRRGTDVDGDMVLVDVEKLVDRTRDQKEEIERLKTSLEKAEEEAKSEREKRTEQLKESTRLMEEHNKALSQSHESARKHMEAQAEVLRLTGELSKRESSTESGASQLIEAQSAIADLNAKIKRYEVEASSAAMQLDDANARTASMESELASAKQKADEVTAHNSALEAELAAANSKAEEANNRAAALESEMASASERQGEDDGRVAKVEEELALAKAEAEEAKGRIESLKQELEASSVPKDTGPSDAKIKAAEEEGYKRGKSELEAAFQKKLRKVMSRVYKDAEKKISDSDVLKTLKTVIKDTTLAALK